VFEKELEEKLKRIFKVKKVTFDRPSDSKEQECLFINVTSSMNSIKDGRAKAKVIGEIFLIGNTEKLKFGYFSKCLAIADSSETSGLFFHTFEENNQGMQNIVQRKCSFVYFFDSQYDPDTGTITSVDITEE
jgi:hypothetical protein